MSRSGYSDDYEPYDTADFLRMHGYSANVRRHLSGRDGQRFLWELYLALTWLPAQELITRSLVTQSGCACALGAVALARKLDMSGYIKADVPEDEDYEDDDDSRDEMASLLKIKEMMAAEVMYQNDDCGGWHWVDDGSRVLNGVPYGCKREYRTGETDRERWLRMRRWVVSRLKDLP